MALQDKSGAAQPMRGLRILLVDDDPLILRAVRVALENDGHTVTTAVGGRAGIEAFLGSVRDGQAFEVVITDFGMPEVGGAQVSAAVKAASPGTYVLLLSGRTQGLADQADGPLQIDAELVKPPTALSLRETLAKVPRAQ